MSQEQMNEASKLTDSLNSDVHSPDSGIWIQETQSPGATYTHNVSSNNNNSYYPQTHLNTYAQYHLPYSNPTLVSDCHAQSPNSLHYPQIALSNLQNNQPGVSPPNSGTTINVIQKIEVINFKVINQN